VKIKHIEVWILQGHFGKVHEKKTKRNVSTFMVCLTSDIYFRRRWKICLREKSFFWSLPKFFHVDLWAMITKWNALSMIKSFEENLSSFFFLPKSSTLFDYHLINSLQKRCSFSLYWKIDVCQATSQPLKEEHYKIF
jgi:hypothetical protein